MEKILIIDDDEELCELVSEYLAGEGFDVERYLVLSQLIDGRWPSDHFPVIVDITVAECR